MPVESIFHLCIFLLMNLTVAASAVLLSGRIFRISGSLDFFISAFLLYLGQIIAGEMLLGILGILYLDNLLFLNLAVLSVVWLLARGHKSSASMITGGAISEILHDKAALFLAAIILVFGIVKCLINLVNPPFGWDSLNYHFVFPVEWLKYGNLDIPITICDDPAPSYFPINGSLYYLWLMLPLRNVFFADLGQLPFFILCLVSVYGIARKIGLEKIASFYAAGLFFIIPNFFKQLSISYVDVMVAGLFLACVWFLFSLNKEFSLRYCVLFGISLGLLLGVKTIGLPYGFLLVLPFFALCFRSPPKAGLPLLVALLAVLFGSYTYLRNFFVTGNPIYPLEYKLFGKIIFKGVIDQAAYSAHFPPGSYRLDKILFHEGLGAQTLVFVLPSMFLALPLALLKKRKPDFILTYFLTLPLLIFCVYRFVIPLANLRYIYPLLAIGMILGFYTAELLRPPGVVIRILVALCAIVSMFELAKRLELASSLILTFTLLPLLLLIFRGRRRKKISLRPAAAAVIFFALFIILALLEGWYLQREFPRYLAMKKYSGFWPDAARAWDWLNSRTAGSNIAYVGRPVAFPLYGTNFKNNVYYVSVNNTDPAKLHYYPGSRYHWGDDFLGEHRNFEEDGNYRGGADYSVWLKNLIRRNTDYLFVYSLHQTKEVVFPLEDRWAGAHPEKFTPVFTNQTVHIYKVNR